MTARTSEGPARSDVLLVLALLVLVTTLHVGGFDFVPSSPHTWFLLALSTALTLALLWRRTHPLAVAAVQVLLIVAHLLMGEASIPADFMVMVTMYNVAASRSLAASLVAYLVAVPLLVYTMGVFHQSLPDALAGSAGWVALALVPWTVGRQAQARSDQLRLLEDATARLETEKLQLAQLATSNERTRIAREMHDIIAHSLSVMIAQADGGRYAVMSDPAAGQRALETIADVGRASLADMRRLLGVLRDPDTNAATTVPQPIDADLDELVATVRDAGLRVSLVRMGQARPLPPGAGLTVYRIVQEALTNAMKHAGPKARVTVMIQWLHSALGLEISDDGRGAAAASDGKGQGLIGMQERAAIFGGTVSAGPRPGGGFQVKILIPLPEDRARSTHQQQPGESA